MFVFPVVIVAAPALLLGFGVACDASGRYCGAGEARGGRAMISVGAIMAAALCLVFLKKLEAVGRWLQSVTFEGGFAVVDGIVSRLLHVKAHVGEIARQAKDATKQAATKARELGRAISKSASFWISKDDVDSDDDLEAIGGKKPAKKGGKHTDAANGSKDMESKEGEQQDAGESKDDQDGSESGEDQDDNEPGADAESGLEDEDEVEDEGIGSGDDAGEQEDEIEKGPFVRTSYCSKGPSATARKATAIALLTIGSLVVLITHRMALRAESMRKSAKIVAASLLLAIILGIYGTRCIYSNGASYCGAGGYDGGISMLIFSALFLLAALALALWLLNNSDVLDERRAAFVAFSQRAVRLGLPSIGVSGSSLMLVFGSLCLEHGEYCGPRDTRGGVVMVCMGGVLSLGMLFYLWRRCSDTAEAAHNSVFVALLLVVGQVLAIMGSLCIEPDNYSTNAFCGAGGEEAGGGSMVVFGGVFLVAAALLAHLATFSEEYAKQLAVWSERANTVVAVSVMAAGPVLLVDFGAMCVANGHFCGPASNGSKAGGKAMAAVGGVLTAFTCYCVWYQFMKEGQQVFAEAWRVLAGCFVAGELFSVFGAICVDSYVAFGEGGSYLCGEGGFEGGIVMLSVAGVCILGAVFGCASMHFGVIKEESVQQYVIRSLEVAQIIFPFLACSCASLLLTFGSWCVTNDSGQYCGAGGTGGGWAMVVLGGLFSLAIGVFMFNLDIEEWDAQTKACVLYFGGELMGVFGGICISTDGRRYCGDAGIGGGWAMLVLCGCLVTFAGLYRCRESYLTHLEMSPREEVTIDSSPPPIPQARRQARSNWRARERDARVPASKYAAEQRGVGGAQPNTRRARF
eukprot:g6388.t1